VTNFDNDPSPSALSNPTCLHPFVRGMYAEDQISGTTIAVWACDDPDCSRRFYPACETCVSVGHREGHGEHP